MEHKDITQLNKDDISSLLKAHRGRSGKTVDEVLMLLKSHGIEISPKTLYSYENATSSPNVRIFLALCDIYGIDDIQAALGYTDSKEKPVSCDADGLSPAEAGIIKLFRLVPEDRSDMVLHMIEAALKSQGLL